MMKQAEALRIIFLLIFGFVGKSFKQGGKSSTTLSVILNNKIRDAVITASVIALTSFGSIIPLDSALADARLNAPTAAGTRVNSDAESLLRYGLPIQSQEVREIQAIIENIKMDLKGRRTNFALNDISQAKKLLLKNGEKIVNTVAPKSHQAAAKESLQRLISDVDPILTYVKTEAAAGSGSVQERKNLDDAFVAQDKLAKELTVFEELLVPDDYARSIPEEFKQKVPVLNRRATVEMVVKKPDDSPFNVDGELYDQATLRLVIDGYNAPLTAGNFVDLVNKGFYRNMKITRSDGFVVQTGDASPGDESPTAVHGYQPSAGGPERKVPLEIAIKGDEELLYSSTAEDDGRGSVATVLPFQSYGALGMARSEYEADSASSQFFFLLFESDLTPAGKNMLDGRYTCFGYTVEGAELLKDVKEGDVIVSAKVIDGLDNLVQPSAAASS